MTDKSNAPASLPELSAMYNALDRVQAMIEFKLDGTVIRANQNWGNRDFYPRTGAGADAAEIMQAFIGQFYDQKDPPRQILLSDAIEDAAPNNGDGNADGLDGLLSAYSPPALRACAPGAGGRLPRLKQGRALYCFRPTIQALADRRVLPSFPKTTSYRRIALWPRRRSWRIS